MHRLQWEYALEHRHVFIGFGWLGVYIGGLSFYYTDLCSMQKFCVHLILYKNKGIYMFSTIVSLTYYNAHAALQHCSSRSINLYISIYNSTQQQTKWYHVNIGINCTYIDKTCMHQNILFSLTHCTHWPCNLATTPSSSFHLYYSTHYCSLYHFVSLNIEQ